MLDLTADSQPGGTTGPEGSIRDPPAWASGRRAVDQHQIGDIAASHPPLHPHIAELEWITRLTTRTPTADFNLTASPAPKVDPGKA